MRVMVMTIAVFSIVSFAILAAGQSSDTAHGPKVCAIRVSGMFCGECAKTVEKTATKIEGVKSAKVSQPRGLAEITYDPAKTNPEAIAQAISKKTPFKAEPKREPDSQK